MSSDTSGQTTRRQEAGARTQVLEVAAFRLTVISGPDQGSRWVICQRSMRLGKSSQNEILLQDEMVSRFHATATATNQGLVIKDLGSTNGTWVNGVRTLEAILGPGDEFRVGDDTFRVDATTETYRAHIQEVDGLGSLVGSSPAMQKLYGMIRAVAASPLAVMLQGETGTGKELVARTIHELSGRKGGYRIFDCANTSAEMIRSELFGHEKGAFTGATRDRKGAFREAEGGTLFLDEIGELPLDMQPTLLRVLETGTVQALGADRESRVDVRVVAATHRNLPEEVKRGTFREDLWFRLSVIVLELPPLRERQEDIPLIVDHLIRSTGGNVKLSPRAWEALVQHPWPGNVRALRNVIQRVGVLRAGAEVSVEDLNLPAVAASPLSPPPAQRPPVHEVRPPTRNASERISLENIEKEAILEALDRLGGDRLKVAEELGISLSTLKRRLKTYREGRDDA